MAKRDTEQYRTSIKQVAPQEGVPDQDTLISGIADFGKKIIEQNQDAKIAENFSLAQLDLAKVNNDYQTKWASNPFGGLDELKEARKNVYDQYGADISPFFKSKWDENVRSLDASQKLQTEVWGFGQTKKNTVSSINRSIKNNLGQATMDGYTFGTTDSDEMGALLNFAASKKQLAGFGDAHLGSEETTNLLEGYDDDYTKSFMSGLAESNPIKALRLMESDKVKNSFKDQGQYLKMKTAVEARAMNVTEVNTQKEVLSTLKNENSMLTKSLDGNVSYAELQQEFARTGMSKSAQSFFLKANGYKPGGEGLSSSEQFQQKAQLYSDMTEMMSADKVTSANIANFQERIYQGMDNKSLNEKEGTEMLNQLVAPLIAQKEQAFQTYSQDHWIAPDVGFGGVKQMFDDKVKIQLPAGYTEVSPMVQAINNANQVKLYDYYMSSLKDAAATYNVPMAGIQNLNKVQQQKLYSEAQADAFKRFSVDQNPALATLPDLPNQTLSGGKLIQGAAGTRNIKPDVSIPAQFKMMKGDDGYLYRKYPSGLIERVGKAPK